MIVAVTGATGFIGKNLIKEAMGDKYICLLRSSSDDSYLNQFDKVSIKRLNFNLNEICSAIHGAQVVIHMLGQMGSYGIPDSLYEKVNCEITQAITQACIKEGIQQLIYISTPGVQGFGGRLRLETDAYAPRNSYEQTKVKAEKIIIQTTKNTDVCYTILRPDFVYGPGDTRRIKMYKNIRDHKFVLTTSGKSYVHPTYVLDVVQGILKSVGNPKAYNQIFNISAKNDIQVKDYLQVIADYFHVGLIKINIGYHLSRIIATLIEKSYNFILKKEGFVTKNKIDFLALDHSTSNQKAQELLGYQPEYDFKTGFSSTMKWYEDNKLI